MAIFSEQENNNEARHFEGGYCSGSWQLVVTRKTKNNQSSEKGGGKGSRGRQGLMVLMVSFSLLVVETVVAAVEQGASVRSPRSRARWGGRGGGGEEVSRRKRDAEG